MLLLILGFVGGVFVGYKYPQQVEQVMETFVKWFNDLKKMISKKETPPQS
jgi:Na+/H+-dicarboxylate symporter